MMTTIKMINDDYDDDDAERVHLCALTVFINDAVSQDLYDHILRQVLQVEDLVLQNTESLAVHFTCPFHL